MRLYRLSFVTAAVTAALLCGPLAGCASGPSTKLVSAWQLPGYVPTGFHKMLVIFVSRDGGRRRTFEDAFCYQLLAHHLQGIPSYSLIPQDGQVPNDVLEAAIRKSGVDAVLATRFLGASTNTSYTNGGYYVTGATPTYYGGFYGYYGTAYTAYYEPPKATTTTVITVETDVFDAAKLEMVWSGTTQTTNPTTLNQEMAGFARLIIDEMAQRGVVTPSQP